MTDLVLVAPGFLIDPRAVTVKEFEVEEPGGMVELGEPGRGPLTVRRSIVNVTLIGPTGAELRVPDVPPHLLAVLLDHHAERMR